MFHANRPVVSNHFKRDRPYNYPIDHFTRCKQHWSRNTSCFSL